MTLLAVTSLRKNFGGDPLLEQVEFSIQPGEHVALVGPNGCGKTTLLRILAGLEEPDEGQVQLAENARVAYLEQHFRPEPGVSVWQEAEKSLSYLIELRQQAEKIAEQMARTKDPAHQQRLAARYDMIHQKLDHGGGYTLEQRLEFVLQGLGFGPDRYKQPVESLSGGELNRLMLAKVLLAEPDLMLLDEPSNHLDVETTVWLEEYLVTCRSAFIVVSHDRYFLDRVVTRVLELHDGRLESYKGNFSAYEKQKEERLLVLQRTYEKQLQELRKAEDFVRRYAAGQRHKQAEDRRKKIERIELVRVPKPITIPPMQFTAGPRSGDVVLKVEALSKSFEKPLFLDLSFDVEFGQRWVVMGPNGCGKTTLLRCLLGLEKPDAGSVVFGHGVKPAYFDQHLISLPEDLPALEAVRPDGRTIHEQQRREALARFGIGEDLAEKPIRQLSGGQRCRVALARLSLVEANLLVMDEPTNHLDLWARQGLLQALQKFDGTVMLVTHDRYLVDQLADRLIVMQAGGAWQIVHGNYSTYKAMAEASGQFSQHQDVSEDKSSGKQSAKPAERPKRERRKRRFPYRKLQEIEQDILEHETRIEEINRELIDPEVLRDGQRVKALQQELERLRAELALLYEHWEEAVELDG